MTIFIITGPHREWALKDERVKKYNKYFSQNENLKSFAINNNDLQETVRQVLTAKPFSSEKILARLKN